MKLMRFNFTYIVFVLFSFKLNIKKGYSIIPFSFEELNNLAGAGCMSVKSFLTIYMPSEFAK